MITAAPSRQRERTLLVRLENPDDSHYEIEESLAELSELVRSAGGQVTERATQKLDAPTAPFYIGRGKAEELARISKQKDIQSVVFDGELSPAQARNLEGVFSRKVIDRTQLILDIFAQRARTSEGKLQIELAQLQYLLPRLTGMWSHLSRQTGGIGTRGPGETQLEVDRRRVQERISRLERELAEVRKHRGVQRQGRMRQHWPVCALVGYTNAGKSTLMNRLTSADVFANDQLFATLDPTIRQFHLPNRQKVLLSDTVGFIQKLPHHLVESFRATLEEVHEADLLIHVVDVSNPNYAAQIEAVDTVLKQIDSAGKQTFFVFNKTDKLLNPEGLRHILDRYAYSVALSAKTGEGMDRFFGELENLLKAWRMRVRLRLPQSEGGLLSEIHRVGRVLETHYEGNDIHLVAHIPPVLEGRLKPFILPDADPNSGDGGERKAERATLEAGGGQPQDL